MPSELKRYLDGLANGPMLDPVTKPGPYLKGAGFDAILNGAAPACTEELVKRRKAIIERCAKAKPLVVRRSHKHKT